jgi:hypothetical protein
MADSDRIDGAGSNGPYELQVGGANGLLRTTLQNDVTLGREGTKSFSLDFQSSYQSPRAVGRIGPAEQQYRDGDKESFDSNWTESTTVPRRSLGFVQCSALMINQMIGTGVFTLPGVVLLLTKSKPIAITLWAVGGIYSLLRLVERLF